MLNRSKALAEDYEVRQGDCISSLAFERGFFWETLWNHPKNADLKSKRANPNILKEGDVVYIPDLTLKEESRGTDAQHCFKVKGAPAKLRLRILEEKEEKAEEGKQQAGADASVYEDPPYDPKSRKDKPRANVPYLLDIDGKVTNGTTDGDGRVEIALPPNARQGRLILDPGTPREKVLPLGLGTMDPVTEISGVRMRLNNLGFPCGEEDEITPELESALGSFQEKNGLDVTRQIDAPTRDTLKRLHGS